MENGLGSYASNLVEKAMKNEIMDSKVEEKAKVGHHESKISAGDNDLKDSLEAEVPAMKNEIMDSKVEEKAKVGYHESKNSAGDNDFKDSVAAEVPAGFPADMVINPVVNMNNDEVSKHSMVAHKKTDSATDYEKFEEAIDVLIDVDIQEERMADIKVTKEEPVALELNDKPKIKEASTEEDVMDKNKDSEFKENDMAAAHTKTDSGNDFEKFEEAVDVLTDIYNKEEQLTGIEDTSGVLGGAEPVNKLEEKVSNGEGVLEKVKEDGSDKRANNMAVSKQEDEVIDVPDISAAADDKKIMDEEKGREVQIAAVHDEEIQEDAIVENHENGVSDDVNLKRTLDHEISNNGSVNVEILTVEEEPKTVQNFLPIDSDSSQPVDFVESLDQAGKVEEVKEILSSLDNSHEDKDRSENKREAASGVHIGGVEEANSNSVTGKPVEGDKNSGEEKTELAEISNTLRENGTHGEMKDAVILADTRAENKEEFQRDVATLNLDHHLTNGKPDPYIMERKGTPEVKITPISEAAEVEKVQKVQEIASDKVLEEAGISLKPADKSVKPSNVETKKEERVGVNVEEAKQNTREANASSEIKPKSNVFENSTTLPARPASLSLKPADKSVKPPNADTKKEESVGDRVEEAKQNTRGENGSSEIKPKSNVSENSTTLPARPAGLGRTAPLLETAPRVMQQNRANGTSSHTQSQIVDDVANGEAEETDETREKLQMIRVKFLRLAHRLGQTPHNVVVAQVLYRLGLAEQLRGRNGGRVAGFSFDRASAMAEQLEAAGQEPLDFSCTIMVLGKSGVGKSSTINSIFDEVKFPTDAFQQGTKKVQDVVGTVQGIKVRVIDTPGLLPSWSDQRQNEKILLSVKRFIKKTPPDIVLYLDRMDMQTRDLGDMPLLRTITDIFGPSIWFNAIVVLTHAASAPPEGSNGTATSYDMFVTNRSHVVQQAIRQAAGDMRLMNPVSLVENHSACRKNRAGQRVLPNGQVWKPHLLLLSFASKILAEANTLLKLQDSPPGRPFATRTRAPPLPYLLSTLLQSRPQLKLPEDQLGDDDVLEADMDESSDSEDESEYDELPTFKRLTKDQLGNLTKDQKKAYYAELEYREELFMKKQLKEEKKRRKIMKKMAASANEMPSEYSENIEEESGGAASVPVPMPDLALPASFDSDNPTHRYRYLDSPNQWVVRPVLDSHGWDHDIGYEGVNVERLFVVKEKIPMSFSGQITKDKKDANMQMEIGSSIKHGEGKSTSLGLDMQSLGKDMAYTLRSETKFSNYKRNKATAGFSVTKLGDTVSAGVKIEDQLIVNKRLRVVASGGAMTGRGDMAYGGSFEATLRDKDHPLGRSLSTLGLSVMDWHGDLAIGANIQSQIPVGRSTNLIARANLNNKGSGQVSIRLNSSEQLQIVLVALIPLIRKALGHVQLSQFGQ